MRIGGAKQTSTTRVNDKLLFHILLEIIIACPLNAGAACKYMLCWGAEISYIYFMAA